MKIYFHVQYSDMNEYRPLACYVSLITRIYTCKKADFLLKATSPPRQTRDGYYMCGSLTMDYFLEGIIL